MSEPTVANRFLAKLTKEKERAVKKYINDGDPFTTSGVRFTQPGNLKQLITGTGVQGGRVNRGQTLALYYNKVLTAAEQTSFQTDTGLS